MSKYKILIKITGSIAAYKVGYLISKLIQNGFEVKTVVTKSALNFIGLATLEGLTGNHVYCDTFENGKMMSHINLTKWADLTILVPADANTINKYSNGIADNLVTSLFLAHDCNKPYLVAPAMNVHMYNHPATQNSLKKLEEWGIIILPTDEGYLACGDEGKGKLLNPDKIYNHILRNLADNNKKKKILITSGGTREKIDNVRYITNLSTGKTGSSIADFFYLNGHDVTMLKSAESIAPVDGVNIIDYSDYNSLKSVLQNELQTKNYDAVIHLAAVSDFSPISLHVESHKESLPANTKLSSTHDNITIELKRNKKLINKIKLWSQNKNLKLFGFKLVNSSSSDQNNEVIKKLFDSSDADYIVRNSLDNRVNNTQNGFEIISNSGKIILTNDAQSLSTKLEKLLLEE